jgi:hypothetical protein
MDWEQACGVAPAPPIHPVEWAQASDQTVTRAPPLDVALGWPALGVCMFAWTTARFDREGPPDSHLWFRVGLTGSPDLPGNTTATSPMPGCRDPVALIRLP